MYRNRFLFALAMAGLAAILLPSPLPAQITFQRTYGGTDGDAGFSVQQTSDSGYIVAGYTYSFGAGGEDVYLIKTDASGDTLWTRTYGGTHDDDGGASVQQTADGGYVVTGQTYRSDSEWVYVVKADPEGNFRWSRTYGDSWSKQGNSVRQTTDHGCAVAGQAWTAGLRYQAYLIKTDSVGDTMWTRTFGGTEDEAGYSVQQTTDSGYIIAGCTYSFGADSGDVYLIKTNAGGDTLWTRTFGGAHEDWGNSVQQTSDGGYVVAGYTCSFGAGHADVYLIRTNANGDTLWTRTYGGADYDYGQSVEQTADGGYVIAGYTCSFGAGGADAYLIKTNSNGDTLWTRAFGGPGDDEGCSVQQTFDGGYVVGGFTYSFGAGFEDVYLIKTDSLGKVAVAVAEPKANPTRAPALSLTCEPNPFRSSTVLRFSSLLPPHSSLSIFDAAGRLVRSFSSLLSPHSSLTWDGTDDLGYALPSGAYFITLDAAGHHATARIVLQH